MTRKDVVKEIYRGNKINFIFLLISSLFEALMLIVTSLMLEKLIAIASAKDIDGFIQQGIIFLILLAISILIFIFVIIVKPIYKKKAIKQYKNNIYRHILNKSIDDFFKYDTSTYVSALTNDVNYIEENYIFSTFGLLTQIILIILTITIMILYSPLLTLISIALSMFPLIIALTVGSKLSNHEKRISDANANFMSFVKDNFIGFSTIKVFKSEKRINELFKKNNDTVETIKSKKTKTVTILEFLQSISSLIAQFGVFFVSAYFAITTDKITVSIIILFVQLMNYVLSPLMTIPMMFSKRQAAKPLFDKIAEILTAHDSNKKTEFITEFNDKIKIENLTFGYDEKTILNEINYEFDADKSYAIVGTSGSGKTTLLNLLIGRNNNFDGTIKYDEYDIKDLSIDSLFELTSYIEQNVFVFDDSIVNNITMYSEVDDDILNDVVIKSGLEKLIKEKGKDYICGENGCNLSGGEKQRIAIARALLKKSRILLIDEATSSLDNETSTNIINNVLNLESTTKIVITHKLEETTLKRFDEIIVLKNGTIVEHGNFETLIDKKGYFNSLFNLS